MLVLSRTKGESVIIGEGEDAVTVMVIKIGSNGAVKIGVEAPRRIAILRSELEPHKKEGMGDGKSVGTSEGSGSGS